MAGLNHDHVHAFPPRSLLVPRLSGSPGLDIRVHSLNSLEHCRGKNGLQKYWVRREEGKERTGSRKKLSRNHGAQRPL